MVLSNSIPTFISKPSKDEGSSPLTLSSAAAYTPVRFGTDGIRGKVGDQLTPDLALRVGYCAGQELRSLANQQGPFILGQDSRNSSDMLAMALSAGLTAAGVDVWNLGLCPTPAVAYLAHHTDALGGVMISASHNPPADNGIKFFNADGSKLQPPTQRRIEERLQGEHQETEAPRWGHHYSRPELTQAYVEGLQAPLQAMDFRGLRVVLDLAWGAATQLAPAIFAKMGAEVICLHDQPDGDRINVNCGSTHLDSLKAAVQLHSADIGFGFDGDADRVLAVDSQGRTVDGDYILYLWGTTLATQQQLPNDLIVATVMSNLGFERAWQAQGGKLLRTNVGDQYVHAQMLQHGSMLGGEQSGHILCPHYGISGDGLLTALHVTAILRQSGRTLSALVDDSFQLYPQLLKNIRVEDPERRRQWQNCDPLQRVLDQATQELGDQGRILVRASGTEPLMRVMVEACQIDLVTDCCDRSSLLSKNISPKQT
ncbi:MAG: phosphoglucosamine mutase [Acaryochloridaceae cyanobacterium SU_2_1]|nr:phosphoglucosamine mutase [Acaryochloridaceae cyanobacterium SU_2_1]